MSNLIDLYPHNKMVFNKVLENLKTHNKVGVVQATGTGKGKLAACFVEYLLSRKKGAKILIVAPLRSVLENYRDNFNITSDSVKYATYSKINNLSDVDLINIGQQFDLIVLDEYHRCGAPEWFKSIQTLFNGVDKGVCKVIGLTATPIRYLDNSRDMSEELFNGNVIEGLNLEDAILDGILPGFIYNACYFGTEKVLKEVEDKLKNNDYKISDDTIRNDLMVKVKELNMIYQNRYKIENIIKDNTKDLGINQKWVIFCRDKQSLVEIRGFCVNWFNYKPDLYIINSDRQSKDNDRTLVEFRKAKQGVNVLLCVDMLNEGVHIKDLNGVIMLRKTDSPIIFLQQLGRSLEAGKDFKPVIFDLIGNYKGLSIKENDEIEKTPIEIVKGIEKKTKSKKNYVIVHNFMEEMDNVLLEISKYHLKYFTDEEDAIIQKYYPLGGYKLCQENGLRNRSKQAIYDRAYKLGLKSEMFFSSEEDEIIKKFYSCGGTKLCQENGLENRSKEAIRDRAYKLGLSRNIPFSTDEIAILKEFYPIGGVKLCQESGLEYRSATSIKAMAQKIGVKGATTHYSFDEIKIIKKYFPMGGAKLCREKGLKRSEKSICNFVLLYNSKSVEKIEGIIKEKVPKNLYTEEEIKIILEYYPIGGEKLCRLKGLKRTKNSITSKAHSLGLFYNDSIFTDLEIGIIKKYYPIGGSRLCIEKGVLKTPEQIRDKAYKLDLRRDK